MIADPPAQDAPSVRRQSRQDRQARVGILRNPNDPPRPRPRKAPLMGRWLSLRSARRPPAAQIEDAALAVVAQVAEQAGQPAPDLALRRDADGQLAGIDIAQLMASVDGLGTQKPVRTPYAAQMRPDLPEPPVAPPRRMDTGAERLPDPEPLPDPPAAPVPVTAGAPVRRRRTPRARWIAGGFLVAFLLVIVLPAALTL